MRLGLQYIWIDSLCIIQSQPSKEDWNREASLMGKVYSKAYCNIAATGALDGTVGLFHERDPYLVFPSAFSRRSGGSSNHLIHTGDWSGQVLSSPLLRRGWVVQERLLASRVLHFGAKEVMWECCSTQGSERFPAWPLDENGLFKSQMLPMLKEETDHGSRFEVAYNVWISTVETYSFTELTFSSDKLPALSGLAAKIGNFMGIEYLAGLWKAHLPEQLLWRTRHTGPPGLRQLPTSKGPKPDPYVAPSWSWASSDLPVWMPPPWPPATTKSMIHVVDAKMTTLGQNAMGEVTSGYIVVCGALTRVTQHSQYSARIVPNTMVDIRDPYKLSLELDAYVEPSPQNSWFFLPVIRCKSAYENKMDMRGLALEVVDKEAQQYRRIGMWHWQDNDLIILEGELEKSRVEGLKKCQCEGHDEQERSRLSTITII